MVTNGRFLPMGSDAEIIDNMDPGLDLNVDWLQIRKTPAKKINISQKNI